MLTTVRSHARVDVRAKECTLDAGHRGWVGAVVAPDRRRSRIVLRRVERRVALEEDVEGGTKVGSIALCGALRDIVLFQGDET